MIDTYVFVYSVYTLICYVLAIVLNNYKLKGNRTKILLIALMAVGALIAAIRPENTQDTGIYNSIYQDSLIYSDDTSVFDIQELFGNRIVGGIEMFYILIMGYFRNYFDSPVVFYFVQGFLSNILMVKGLYLLYENIVDRKEETDSLNSRKAIIIYALYQMFCGVLYTSSAIRDGLSISIGIFSIANLLSKRRELLAYVLLVFSVLVHTTSIIFFPIYSVLLIWKRDIRNNAILLMSLLIPVLYFLRIGAVFVGGFVLFFEKVLALLNINFFVSYLNLLNYQLPYREGVIVVLTSAILAIISVSGEKIIKNTASYIMLVFIGLLIMVSAYPIPAVVRFVYIFILFLVPVVARMELNANAVYIVWSLLFVPQFIYVFGYFL